MSFMDGFQIWLMAFFTLAIFSFIYRDNPVYRFAEHLFAGLSAGYYIALYLDTTIYQQLWVPMTIDHKWWLAFPGILGVLMFSRLVPNMSWLARLGLAFVMGTTAGVSLTAELHGKVLYAIHGTVATQAVGGSTNYLLTSIVVIGVISTLIYFYFSKEHTGALGVTAKVGVWFIMIAFGASFGYTVMGRISLLIGRVYFLYTDWIGSISHIF